MTEHAGDTPLAGQLKVRFGDTLREVICVRGETTIVIAPSDLIEVATALRDEPEFDFRAFVDVCGVDYLSYGHDEWATMDASATSFSRGAQGQAQGRFDWEERPDPKTELDTGPFEHRFASVLHLLSHGRNQRVRVRVPCEDDDFPAVPSLTSLWSGANWFERESFDLYGIIYEGHPDLRRILTDYGFVGHPFRKDFPLIGNVEVRYDPEAGRVIYEPVSSVESRVTVPRVIRNDSDLLQAKAEATDLWREN